MLSNVSERKYRYKRRKERKKEPERRVKGRKGEKKRGGKRGGSGKWEEGTMKRGEEGEEAAHR